MTHPADTGIAQETEGFGDIALRPRSLMLTFLGRHVLHSGLYVYSGSIIDVFARAGVGEHATRSTLTRMAGRGLLRRRREGRRMYFGLTDRAAAVLRDGENRIWKRGAVNDDWDGTWTLLAFSLPESSQHRRNGLRSQLTWAGFGPLIGGLWIAPGHADVTTVLGDEELAPHIRVFRSTADPATDITAMIRDTWDLTVPAAGYTAFRNRWRPLADGTAHPGDELAAQLRLLTEWLRLVRSDPHLPVRHLPEDWPAAAAEDVFHRAHDRISAAADAQARRLLETTGPAEE